MKSTTNSSISFHHNAPRTSPLGTSKTTQPETWKPRSSWTAPHRNGKNLPSSGPAVSTTPASEDLHLKDLDNNARDTGTDLSASFSIDVDGGARPQGIAWDLGADETGSASATVVNYRSIGTDASILYQAGQPRSALERAS